MEKITKRQEKILNAVIEEYTKTAEPVSSKFLAKKKGLDVSSATIRNEFQELTDMGFIYQPHTSAGRVPAEKAYRYFLDKIAPNKEKQFTQFIFREVRITKQTIDNELKLADELKNCLEEMRSMLNFDSLPEGDSLLEIMEMLGPSRSEHEKNINLMRLLLKSFEDF